MSLDQAAEVIRREGEPVTVLWRADREQAKRHGVKALSTDTEGTLIDRMFQEP